MKWIIRWLWHRDSLAARNVCLLMADYMNAEDLRAISNHFSQLWKFHDMEDEEDT